MKKRVKYSFLYVKVRQGSILLLEILPAQKG